MKKEIGLFAGSLRKASFSKKLAKAIQSMAPEGFVFTIIPIGELPLYNQDYDENDAAPESYTEFRNKVKQLDGLIFITPEYNRSVPGVLKNAIDVGSRPSGKSVWNGKPGAVISVSPGNVSGFGANHHLRQSLVCLNVPTMAQPEMYIARINTLFDEKDQLNNEGTRAFLQKGIDAYIDWFRKNAAE